MSSPEELSLHDGSTAIQMRPVIRKPPNSLQLDTPISPRSITFAENGGWKSPNLPPPPPPEEEEETDEEVLEVLGGPSSLKTVKWVKPNKSQVLFYLSAAPSFRLKRVGTDIQITDPDDFPLFDVWLDMDCCRCTWVVESYGRLVLLLHEQTGGGGPELCCCKPSRRSITVTDWNGDVFGFLVPGDPFLLQNPERQTVAKLIPHSPSLPPPLPEPAYDATSSTKMLPVGLDKRLCWLCVLEGSGRHIARLEDMVSVQYNKDVSFQLKLLTLAGIIRLSGPWMMPGRGESRHTMGSFSRFVSSILNCCAYCFY